MISIRLPQLDWPGKKLEEIYSLLQKTPELGFLYKDSIKSHVRENKERGTLWAAYLKDGTLAGVATIGSRRLYAHLARHGEIAILPPFRRRRIGTAFYFTQILQSLLEGRREVEDTIIPALSPWMAGPTECKTGKGFLPSLNYTMYGTLPKRTTAFKDIQLWGHKTYELDDYVSRLPDASFELLDTEKSRSTFKKNMETYGKHDEKLLQRMTRLREWAIEEFDIKSDETDEAEKPKKGLIF